MALNNNNRPVFLDLTRIHLPVPAVLSIAHRMTGVLLFLFLPFSIYLLQHSLASETGFAQVMALGDSVLMRAVAILLLWFFFHHLFAGIRYLLIDIDIGVGRESGRKGAWIVLVAAIVVTLFFVTVIL